jgi:hypothetical protein
MLFKLPERRAFHYTPLYYRPERDPEEKRKKRLHFPRPRRSTLSIVRWLIPLMILLLLLSYVLKKLDMYF